MNYLQLEPEHHAEYMKIRQAHEANGVNYEELGKLMSGVIRLPAFCERDRRRRESTASRSSVLWHGKNWHQ